MAYINFEDKDGNILIDSLNREFLVKSTYRKNEQFLTFERMQELISDGTVSYTFYLYSLYDDETVKEDLSDFIVPGGNLSITYQSGIRRKLSIGLFNNKGWLPSPHNGFLWKGAKFKLDIGVITPHTEYLCPAGVFLLQSFEMPHKYQANEIALEMVDKFGGIDGTVGGKLVDSIYIPRGSNIVDMVESLLKTKRISGMCFDNKRPIIPTWAYNATTPYTISETSESSIGSLIINLLSIINLDVFYDEYGRLCCEEMRENMLENSLPSVWTFSNGENIYGEHSTQVDFQEVENVVVIEGANINGDIVSVRVENNNPKSPTNISLFEPTICKITDENISDITSCYLRANYELFKRSLLPISETFSTVLIPILNVNNVVTINDDYCGLVNAKFLITSISISIDVTPKMNITISNLEEVGFDGKSNI